MQLFHRVRIELWRPSERSESRTLLDHHLTNIRDALSATCSALDTAHLVSKISTTRLQDLAHGQEGTISNSYTIWLRGTEKASKPSDL